MDLDSHAMQQAIEAEILEKCRLAPNGSTSMANLLGDKQHLAMPGLYLMAATNLCSQGKVRLQQTSQELDNLIVTLISEQQAKD